MRSPDLASLIGRDEEEEEQTIQMICTDVSDYSNCHKISLGHGVPGTILEMLKDCGPSKDAVAKTMVLSEVQLSPHLAKRCYSHQPVVYDRTFDFDWRRVPRDLGDTQMRVDFSNEVVSVHIRLVGRLSNTLA